MTAPEPTPTACDGSFVCDAVTHEHGCFSDDGRCEEPGQHGRPEPTAEHTDAAQEVSQ